MSRERQLIAADGTTITYTVEGEGPALLLTNGLTTNTAFWKYLRPIWLRYHTVITWDLPGHGRSGPASSARFASVEAQAILMRDILDACGVQRALSVGWSTGCQLVLEMYRQFPARCAGLALLFGPAGQVLDTTQLPLPGAWFAPLVRATPAFAFELFSRHDLTDRNSATVDHRASPKKVVILSLRDDHFETDAEDTLGAPAESTGAGLCVKHQ